MTTAAENKALEDIRNARELLENAERNLVLAREERHLPGEPSAAFKRFTFTIEFPDNSKQYEFLVVRAASGWYTTGTTEETKRFGSWHALVRWIKEEKRNGTRVRITPLLTPTTVTAKQNTARLMDIVVR